MTVSITTTKAAYNCNGVTTAFNYPFKIFAQTDLLVTVTTAGVDTTLALNTHYTVTGAGDASGHIDVLLAATVPNGSTITLTRNLPLTQETNYVEGDSFPAETHEEAIDRLTMLIQQLSERIDRCLVLPAGTSVTDTDIPVAASSVIAWDGQATAMTTVPITAVTDAVSQTISQTISAKHTFSNGTAQAPFILGANQQAQLVTGLAAQTAVTATTATSAGVKVSANDTTPGVLNGKLTAGLGVTLTEGSDGGNETLSIKAEKASVSSNDSTPGYLNGKLVAGSRITLVEGSDGGNETLTITATDQAPAAGSITTAMMAAGAATGVKQSRLITQVVTGANATLTANDDIVTIDSSSSRSAFLPAVATNTGKILTVCRLGTGAVVLDGNGSETIESNGAAATTLTMTTTATAVSGGGTLTTDCRSVTVQCTGVFWLVIARELYVSYVPA